MQHLVDSDSGSSNFEPLMLAEPSDAAGTLLVRAPFDQQIIAEVETCDLAHVDGALRVAHRVVSKPGWMDIPTRAHQYSGACC